MKIDAWCGARGALSGVARQQLDQAPNPGSERLWWTNSTRQQPAQHTNQFGSILLRSFFRKHFLHSNAGFHISFNFNQSRNCVTIDEFISKKIIVLRKLGEIILCVWCSFFSKKLQVEYSIIFATMTVTVRGGCSDSGDGDLDDGNGSASNKMPETVNI